MKEFMLEDERNKIIDEINWLKKEHRESTDESERKGLKKRLTELAKALANDESTQPYFSKKFRINRDGPVHLDPVYFFDDNPDDLRAKDFR